MADGSNNLNLLGSGLITVTGVALSNTLTITASSTIASNYTANSGSATPAANNLNILGSGSISTNGSGSTITTALTGLTNHSLQVGAGTSTLTQLAVGTNGQVLLGSTAADPSFGTLTSSDSSITFTTGPGTLSLQVAGGTTAIKTITGNTGGAESPSAGNFNILGTGSITVAGTANTETVQLTGLTLNSILFGQGTATIGLVTVANNGVLITSALGVPSLLAAGTTGQVLTATTGSPPTWVSPASSSISITGDSGGALTGAAFTFTGGTTGLTFSGASTTETLTGTLIVANGGTGRATLTNHGVLVGAGTGAITQLAAGTSGQILQSGGGAADPAYSTSTYPTTNAINTLLYASSANVMSALSTANDGVLITSNTGVPSWLANGTTGQVLTATTGSPPSWASPATSGTVTSVSVVSANGFAGSVATATTTPAITLSTTITGVLSGNGTSITGSAVTQFDVLVGGASNAISSVGPGTAGQVLQSGGNAANPSYSIPTYPSASGTSGKIIQSDGTNNIYSAFTMANPGTSGNVLTSNGTNWVSSAPGGGGLSSVTLTLTNAQLKAISTTPVQIIAAQGSGAIIVPVQTVCKLNYGGTNAFTNSPTMRLLYGSVSNTNNCVQMVGVNNTAFCQATSNQYCTSNTLVGSGGSSGNISSTVGENTIISVNGSTDFTGNAANNNTMTVVVLYYVLTI
jgi:hypothetical protein